MPDLGNLSMLALDCSVATLNSPTDALDPITAAVTAVTSNCDWNPSLQSPTPAESGIKKGGEIKVFRRKTAGVNGKIKKASSAKTLYDHVSDWADKKKESGVSESRCSLPFLIGAKKMVECLLCHSVIYPGEEVKCSVRGCHGTYHVKCVEDSLKVSCLTKFRCPHHVCAVCNHKTPHWRCVRCPVASHIKCAPWVDEVIGLKDQPSQAICWRHDPDWRLDGKNEASTSSIEEVFRRLPLPYENEEFKIDLTWKDAEIDALPTYTHIKRNVYLVKRKRDDSEDDIGCTSCSSECSEDCVCRVQYISCSKACRCSDDCKNRHFRKEKKIKIVKTELCGWGVVTTESIDKGEFIVEYIGEVIDDAECERRLWKMKHQNVHNFYMCEIRKDFTIDATFKGNTSRFLNHCCDPNCVLEKWQADGETRVGVFAARAIKVGEPLTYDYRFVQFGPEVACHCGASNCTGYLGTKKKIDKIEVKPNEEMKLSWGIKRRRNTIAYTGYINTTLPSEQILQC